MALKAAFDMERQHSRQVDATKFPPARSAEGRVCQLEEHIDGIEKHAGSSQGHSFTGT